MRKYLKYGIIFIPLLFGIIVSMLLKFDLYESINLPTIAPPKIVFPIVWTILYLLLGVVLYKLRYNTIDRNIFILQLVINYLWCFIFFTLRSFLFSFIVIVILDIIVLYLLLACRGNKFNYYVLIIYFMWLLFASYLNLSIYLIN